jgi:hypothetical protein
MRIEGNKIIIEDGEWVKITTADDPLTTEYEADGPLVITIHQLADDQEEDEEDEDDEDDNS